MPDYTPRFYWKQVGRMARVRPVKKPRGSRTRPRRASGRQSGSKRKRKVRIDRNLLEKESGDAFDQKDRWTSEVIQPHSRFIADLEQIYTPNPETLCIYRGFFVCRLGIHHSVSRSHAAKGDVMATESSNTRAVDRG